MALHHGALTLKGTAALSVRAAYHDNRPSRTLQLRETRRGMLSFLFTSTALLAEPNDSKKALLEEYLKRSRENKAKNDKERLTDYYKRNYKDYFELIEGSVKGKNKELLSESEKSILEWLEKNK